MKNLFHKISASDFLFRFGLSIIFLLNSLVAWFSPEEFLELLGKNPLASAIISPHFWIYIIGINDGLLFLFILFGRWRKGVTIWATLWMIAVLYITIGEGIVEFIEHIGVLSFIAYYYFTFQRPSSEQSSNI